jgi:hypothetical protein
MNWTAGTKSQIQYQTGSNKSKKTLHVSTTNCEVMSLADQPSLTTTLCTKNLSLHCKSGGATVCACIITAGAHNALSLENYPSSSYQKKRPLKTESFLERSSNITLPTTVQSERGGTTPLLGRTQYFLGLVVLTYYPQIQGQQA